MPCRTPGPGEVFGQSPTSRCSWIQGTRASLGSLRINTSRRAKRDESPPNKGRGKAGEQHPPPILQHLPHELMQSFIFSDAPSPLIWEGGKHVLPCSHIQSGATSPPPVSQLVCSPPKSPKPPSPAPRSLSLAGRRGAGTESWEAKQQLWVLARPPHRAPWPPEPPAIPTPRRGAAGDGKGEGEEEEERENGPTENKEEERQKGGVGVGGGVKIVSTNYQAQGQTINLQVN